MKDTRIVLAVTLLLPALHAVAQIEPGSLVDLSVTPAPTTIIGKNGGNRLGADFAYGDYDGNGEFDLAILASSTTAVDTLPPFVVVLFDVSEIVGLVDLATYVGPVAVVKAAPGDAGTWATIATGDFNNDEADDLALGVPNNTQATNYDGKVYVVFGTSDLVGATILLQSPTIPVTRLFSSLGANGWLGMSTAAGDVNNDGRDELLVSAPFFGPSGRVYVMYGQPSFLPTIQLETAPNIVKILEGGLDQACGVGLDCGDANGDGFDDILIGAPGDGLANSRGIVSLIIGAPTLPATISLPNASGVKRFHDEYQNGSLGWRALLADVDGDGRKDAVMGAPVADPLGCQDCGEVYVVYWSESLPDSLHMASSNVPMTRLIGAGHSLHYGESIAAGRINADLCADLIMKREPDDFVPLDKRSVVIAYGSGMRPSTVFLNTDPNVTRVLAEQPGDNLGVGLSISDLNSDGLGEAILGAPLANLPGRTRAGKVHVFSGFPTTTPVSPDIANAIRLSTYPNPFSTSTLFQIEAPIGESGEISIFNVRGQLVFRIDPLAFGHGPLRLRWAGVDNQGQQLPSGVYFCRLKVGGTQKSLKLILVH